MLKSESNIINLSDKEEASRLLPLLRTGRATFTAYGSSLSNNTHCFRYYDQRINSIIFTLLSAIISLFLVIAWHISTDKLQILFASRVLSFLTNFGKERPRRSLPVFAWDNISISILSITERHSLSLHSFIRTPFSIPHGLLSPDFGEKYGLTKFYINNITDNLGSSYSPKELHSRVPKPP